MTASRGRGQQLLDREQGASASAKKQSTPIQSAAKGDFTLRKTDYQGGNAPFEIYFLRYARSWVWHVRCARAIVTSMERRMVRSWFLAALVVALLGGADVRSADAFTILPDRGSLDRFLRLGAVHDNFERFPVDAFGAIPLDVTRLDATTITRGHGPGLVVPGITIDGSGGLQWNGRGYFGQPSRTISGVTDFELDFHDPVTAFGLDLLVFARFPDVALVSVFGADD